MEVCSVDGCERPHYAKTWCRQHWVRMLKYGRLEKIRGVDKGKCSEPDCPNAADVKGLCPKHYQRMHKFGRLYKIKSDGSKGRHSLYNLWAERHAKRDLCERWNDFGLFVEDVVVKPGPDFWLCRFRPQEAYGPDNFEWRERLKRQPGETKKAWHARKWTSRRAHFPDYEAKRWLKRKYGITMDDYKQMNEAQGGMCAICRNPETAYDSKTHMVKSLSVDHCHKTTKVRELLCFRCNSVIGRLHDDIALLDACRAYLVKHAT